MPRLAALVACLILLALPLAGAVDKGDGLASDWETVLEITSGPAGAEKMFEAFDTASLNLYDFNGDGQLEIVSVNDNNRLYVLDSRTGRVLSELETYHYNNEKWPARELNPVAIGALYGDDVPCMVVPNSASFLTAFCFEAAASTPTSFSFEKMWEVQVDAAKYEDDFKETHPYLYYENGTAKHRPGMDGHAYLADVNGDGTLEVFVETDSWPGQFAFSHDGEYLWSRSFADGNAGATVRDIDDDGQKEAIFFSDGGLVTAYTARTGGVEWVFDTRKHGATPGATPVPGLIADLHGDGKFETVFGARNVTQTNDPNWINESHARWYALDHKGKIIWNVSYDWMNPLTYTHPAAADVNDDGVLDVVSIDWNTVGHKPGNWNITNRQANLFALDGRDGSPLWHRGVTIYWSNKDLTIFDVDGDGDQEIVAPTAKAGCEGLGVYDLETGDPRGFYCAGGGWGMTRGPVAGDLYGDGDVYLVVPYNKLADGKPYRSIDVGYREGKLVIIKTEGPARRMTFDANFQLNDEIDTGLKGTSGPPTVTPTPATPTPVTPSPTPASPTPASPTPASPTPASPTAATPTPTGTTPTAHPTTVTATAPAPTNTTTPTVTTLPVTTRATPPPSPNDDEQESTVPGPGVALVAAAAAAAVVLAARRRS